MGQQNNPKSYGLLFRLLHWSMALMIIALFAIGWYMDGLDYQSPLYRILPWWHKSVGILLLVLWVFRLLLKFITPQPKPLPSHSLFEKRIAQLVKVLFYILILILGISGYLVATSKGSSISVFDWFEIPALIELSSKQVDLVATLHIISAWTIVILALIHALAAIKHHLIDKDQTLKRMIKNYN